MATIQSFQYPDCSTLANFKAWAMVISNAFSTFGWTKSSDTGQLGGNSTWAGITVLPAAAGVYEIWTMSDSLAATLPCYVKITYGYFSTSFYNPMIVIQVGTGSNGAGSLTNAGAAYTLIDYNSSLSNTTATAEMDLAGSTNYFSMGIFRANPALATNNCFFTVERSHDANGNDTGSYITYVCGGLNQQPLQQTIYPASNGGPLPVITSGATFSTWNASTLYSQQIVAVPFWPVVGKMDNPLIGVVCLKSGDVTDGLPVTVNHYGASHVYMPFKNSSLTLALQGSGACCVGIRWE